MDNFYKIESIEKKRAVVLFSSNGTLYRDYFDLVSSVDKDSIVSIVEEQFHKFQKSIIDNPTPDEMALLPQEVLDLIGVEVKI